MEKLEFQVSLDLEKLKGAIVTTTKKGTKVLVIPVEQNHMKLGSKSGCYLNGTMRQRNEADKYGNTHFFKAYVGKEVFDAMTDEERNAIPIFGSAKPMSVRDITREEFIDKQIKESEKKSNSDFDDDLPF